MDRKKGPTLPMEERLLHTLRQLLPDAPDKDALAFWDDQRRVIDRIMRKRDVLAIMPTGGGKSACYQVPALELPGITLVISPLLALMRDQIEKLHALTFDHPDYPDQRFPVACFSSAFIADRHKIYDRDDDKNTSFRSIRNRILQEAALGKYKLIYVTPERLQNPAFLRFVQNENVKISMIAVDEAHCISLWGYDFRPRYLEISKLLKMIGYHPTIAAFTATASKPVRKDIADLLGMRSPAQVVSESIARSNLAFSVRHLDGEEKKAELLRFLQKNKGQSGFVYCSTVDAVNEVYGFLKESGITEATRYYAGLDYSRERAQGESKKTNFDDFLCDRKTVIVSTTALGMGIDKRNIRFVLHYNLPLCLENYYQEAGRAGRDDLPAQCILYYTPDDVGTCELLAKASLEESRRALSKDDMRTLRSVVRGRLKRMQEYAKHGEDTPSVALQQYILDYFADQDAVGPSAAKDELDVVTNLKTLDRLYVNRTKVAQQIRKGLMEGEDLVVGRSYNGKPAPTVSYRVTGETLTYFDLMVADAVYTLMKHRIPTIFAKAVMSLLSGRKGLTLRPERREAVEDSIRKMIRTEILIDRTNSASFGFVYQGPEDENDKVLLRGPFLPLTEKGHGFDYEKGTIPPLYEYAEILNGQFFSFPLSYMYMHEKNFSASADNLAMLHYLLCRVHMMPAAPERKRRRKTGQSLYSETRYKVRFDTMIDVLGIHMPEEKKYRNRKCNILWNDRMIPVLMHLQAVGAIKYYFPNAESQTVTFYR